MLVRRPLLSCLALCCLMLLLGCAAPRGATHSASPLPRPPLPDGTTEAELRRMIGQMVLVGFRGTRLDVDAPIVRDVAAGRVGGVILFSRDVSRGKALRNIESPEQVRELTKFLQSRAPVPLLVAVDQEGGEVARLSPQHGFPDSLSALALGTIDNTALTRRAARDMGRVMADVGFNLDLAPVVDVNVNPDNPAIGAKRRSFSADPETVARQARAYIQGLDDAGILHSLKHFPGHGSAWNDSHRGLADITPTWTEQELIPYERLFTTGNIQAVMTAHVFNANLDPEYPATLSRQVISGLLRDRLGFDGVVISDDLQMKAISEFYGLEQAVTLCVNAGVDILLFGNNLAYDTSMPQAVADILLRKVREGIVPVERIREAYGRVMRLKAVLRPHC